MGDFNHEIHAAIEAAGKSNHAIRRIQDNPAADRALCTVVERLINMQSPDRGPHSGEVKKEMDNKYISIFMTMLFSFMDGEVDTTKLLNDLKTAVSRTHRPEQMAV